MDKEVIDAIQANTAVVKLAGAVTSTDYAAIALPDDFKIHSLENFQEFRNNYRAEFKTPHIASFQKYYAAIEGDQDVYVNPSAMSAMCVFDIGGITSPGHAKHRARLILQKTAALEAFLHIVGGKENQRGAAEYVEDWRDLLEAFDGDGRRLDIKTVISTIRKITIESQQKTDASVGDFNQRKSSLESIEAKSSIGALPSMFTLTTEPYNGLPEYKFRFRMSISTGGSEVGFSFQRIKGEADLENIADVFIGVLTDIFADEKVKFLQGTIEV